NLKDRMPGAIVAEGGTRSLGGGGYGSLSKYDMLNTLIAEGPDFKKGLVSEAPSGNSDVTPTVLRILGIDAAGVEGRVLEEALADSKGDAPKAEATELKTERP